MPRALAEEIAHDLWDRSDGQGEAMLSGQNCAYLMERGLGMLNRIKFIGNRYKQVKDPNLIASMSGHSEGSRAFARYRKIDDEMKKELVNLLD